MIRKRIIMIIFCLSCVIFAGCGAKGSTANNNTTTMLEISTESKAPEQEKNSVENQIEEEKVNDDQSYREEICSKIAYKDYSKNNGRILDVNEGDAVYSRIYFEDLDGDGVKERIELEGVGLDEQNENITLKYYDISVSKLNDIASNTYYEIANYGDSARNLIPEISFFETPKGKNLFAIKELGTKNDMLSLLFVFDDKEIKYLGGLPICEFDINDEGTELIIDIQMSNEDVIEKIKFNINYEKCSLETESQDDKIIKRLEEKASNAQFEKEMYLFADANFKTEKEYQTGENMQEIVYMENWGHVGRNFIDNNNDDIFYTKFVDLDGDSIDECIVIEGENYNAEGYYKGFLDGYFSVRVSKEIEDDVYKEVDYCSGYCNQMYPNVEIYQGPDSNKLLILEENGPSADSRINFFVFNRKLDYLGSVEEDGYWINSDATELGIDVRINSPFHFVVEMPFSVDYDNKGLRVLYMEKLRIKDADAGYIYKLCVDMNAYDSPTNNCHKVIIHPQNVIYDEISKDFMWLHFSGENGENGWVELDKYGFIEQFSNGELRDGSFFENFVFAG